MLRKLGLRLPEIALFALNPAIVFQFVVDAHNDIFPLLLALLATAFAAGRPWLALALAVAAGSMKIPFAFAAGVGFSQLASRLQRVSFGVAAVALTIFVDGSRLARSVLFFRRRAR